MKDMQVMERATLVSTRIQIGMAKFIRDRNIAMI